VHCDSRRRSAHSARLLSCLPSLLACWSCTPSRNEATSFADGRALHLVVHARRLPKLRGLSAMLSRITEQPKTRGDSCDAAPKLLA
jgi:hypothetical protein